MQLQCPGGRSSANDRMGPNYNFLKLKKWITILINYGNAK